MCRVLEEGPCFRKQMCFLSLEECDCAVEARYAYETESVCYEHLSPSLPTTLQPSLFTIVEETAENVRLTIN